MSMLRGSGVALYSLTLSNATAIQHAVYGNFSGVRRHEIAVARGKVLQLLHPDSRAQLHVVCSTEVFGQIRSLASFRLPGAPFDYLAVGSDSGRVVILQYQEQKRAFVKVHQETYGRSGCRRIVPGHYVACDPAGRAIMVAAVEKQKFVYVLNRDAASNLTISSPLEAHKSRHVVFALTALDNGFDNPLFAAVELDYTDADQDSTGEAAREAQKMLVLYELDLGLNNVTRKWGKPLDNGANLLIPVPGDSLKVKAEDPPGPGGVLVGAENFVMYVNENHETVQALIPRRGGLPADRNILLVASATHKMRNQFVVLAQSEYGDLYKISLEYSGSATGCVVTELKVKYLDTIPPATALCILKTGFLFAASDSGDHGFYEFQGLGDDDHENEASSLKLCETEEGYQPVFFEPQPLQNLVLADQLMSLAPLTDMVVANMLNEEVPQLFAACGRGSRSTLRMLRPGLSVSSVAVTELPARPSAVWTVRKTQDAQSDDLIVITFADDRATLVLRVGETVQEVNDSGLEGKTATLGMQLLANNSLLQVHAGGLRHINPDRRINKWAPPGRRTVTACATNTHQVLIALSGSDLVYFELNMAGQLLEVEKKEMPGDVACLGIAPVPEGRQRSAFAVVGCHDNTCRILALDASGYLQVRATQTLAAQPVSVMLYETKLSAAEDPKAPGTLFLHIGLHNGLLVRTQVDSTSGRLAEQRTRFLGTRPPALFSVTVEGTKALMALSSRPWVGYLHQGKFQLVPLAYEAFDYVASFASEKVPEGLVLIARNATGTGTLRVVTIDRLGEPFTAQQLRLAFTPRRLLMDEEHGVLITAEADAGVIPYAQRTQDFMDTARALGVEPFARPGELSPELASLEEQIGTPRGEEGQWASCVRVVSLAGGSLQTACVAHLDDNEAALCMCLVRFPNRPEGVMLAVGTAKELRYNPRVAREGFVRLYRFTERGSGIELVHRTPLGPGCIPGAMVAFQDRLLVGVGSTLRLMDCGKLKLLRKCEFQGLPSFVATLRVKGLRVYVGDARESFHLMRYKKQENVFYVFADDSTPRYLTCALQLDYDTMAGADKFGNVALLRLPANESMHVEEDPTGGKFASNQSMLNSASHKVEPIVNFHVGDIVMSMHLCALQQGGVELILYGTISGAIGVLVPFSNSEDLDLFTQLEMHMRQLAPSLVGRDHLAFRGAFFPVKDCIDGDLCEQFSSMPAEKQRTISEETDRSSGEILKKLEDFRNKIL